MKNEENNGHQFLDDLKKYTGAGNDVNSLNFDSKGILTLYDNKYDKTQESSIKISGGKTNYYTIGSIIYFLKNESVGRGVYFTQSKALKLQAVKQLDRKKIKNLLSGKVSVSTTKDKTSPGTDNKKRKVNTGNSGKINQKYWTSQQQHLSTINTILRVRNVDFKGALQKVLKKYKDGELQPVPPSAKRFKGVSSRSRTAYPVILVPGTNSSVVNIANIKEFLEEGIWKQTRSSLDEIRISRKTAVNGIKEFKVINNINKLSYKDLANVVCVFVQGPKWQFKNWPVPEDSNPVPQSMAKIFSTVLGIHVCFDGEIVNPNVQKWNVKCFKIRKQQRSKDQIQSHRIWEAIDTFIMNKKPDLIV